MTCESGFLEPERGFGWGAGIDALGEYYVNIGLGDWFALMIDPLERLEARSPARRRPSARRAFGRG